VLGAMTELDGAHRQKDLQALLLRSTRLLALLSILASFVIGGRPSVVAPLVGKEFVSSYSLVAVLAFGYMINLTQHAALLIIIAKGQHGPLVGGRSRRELQILSSASFGGGHTACLV